jgi:arylsulfatase A-like enzyme
VTRAGAQRPNILLICTDQQRYDALGCAGNPHVQTPVIDGLAADGVLFEQCYTQSPVCAPSRASLVTGQYPSVHGLHANGVSLPAHAPDFSRDLAIAGYDCGMIGKMHLAACFNGRTEPRRDDGYRFYRWAHDPSHASPQNDYHQWLEERHPDLLAQARAGGARVRHQPGGFDTLPTDGHYSRWVSERAIKFLEEERDAETPFFLWANFYDPHHPFVAPPEYLARYDPASLPDPIGSPGELDGKPAIQRDASRASYAGHARGWADYSRDEVKEAIAAYYAMVSLIDDETGRILERLATLGLRDQTLVIFTSDHGEMLGDHHLMLKGPMLYEAAVRVPLIMRWPGRLPAGERRSDIVQWLDLNATILDAAGVAQPRTSQGVSLLPLARGDGNASRRGWAICEYLDSGHPYNPPGYLTMLRHDRYKLVVQHGPPASDRPREGELYDLEADPDEQVNLWDAPGSQSLRIGLERTLLDVMVSTRNLSQPREAFW